MKILGRRGHLVLLGGLLSALVSPAHAQTTNPNVLSFLPSTSHHTLNGAGRPTITNYTVQIYKVGATRPSLAMDVGKPEPGTDGYIRVAVDRVLAADPSLRGGPLEARVVAVGPDGHSTAAVSNIFFDDGCQFVIPGSTQVDGAGGALTLQVTTLAGCSWRAETATPWLTYTSHSAGVGPGSLHVTAAANPAGHVRVGGIAVGSQLVLVFQGSGTALR